METSMDKVNAGKLLTAFGILREALVLLKENTKLVLHVSLLSLLASCLLSFVYSFLPSVIFALVVFPVCAAVQTVTIYAIATAYTAQTPTLAELLWNVKGVLLKLKGPVLTQLCVTLLSFGYMILTLLLAEMLIFSGDDPSANLAFLSILLYLMCFSAAAWFLYLMTLWSLTVTASVLEDDCYGPGAFRRARELIRGRRWKGAAISAVALVLAGAVLAVYAIAFSKYEDGSWRQMVAVLVFVLVFHVLNLNYMAAVTVFYFECRRWQGEAYDNVVAGEAHLGEEQT